MPVSVRTRFDIFKRDSFTCRYCGRTTPDVVLEVDHIVPVCEGGEDDLINLATSCWDCNRGKAGVPLAEPVLGEDPHDRAVAMLEQARMLREYESAARVMREAIQETVDVICDEWEGAGGNYLTHRDRQSLRNVLEKDPTEAVMKAVQLAIARDKMRNLGYVHAVLNNARRVRQGSAS